MTGTQLVRLDHLARNTNHAADPALLPSTDRARVLDYIARAPRSQTLNTFAGDVRVTTAVRIDHARRLIPCLKFDKALAREWTHRTNKALLRMFAAMIELATAYDQRWTLGTTLERWMLGDLGDSGLVQVQLADGTVEEAADALQVLDSVAAGHLPIAPRRRARRRATAPEPVELFRTSFPSCASAYARVALDEHKQLLPVLVLRLTARASPRVANALLHMLIAVLESLTLFRERWAFDARWMDELVLHISNSLPI